MPSRILSQKINTSNSLSHLSPMEEIVFLHLIVSCDDYGRFFGHPSILKGMMFPLREFKERDIEAALLKLESEGMIHRYVHEGTVYLELTAWTKYQTPRAKGSKFPGPADGETSAYLPEDENISGQMQEETNKPEQKQAKPKEDERFEVFWKAYPKKVGKKDAAKAFKKINVSDELLETMISTIEQSKQSVQWQRDDGQYIPNPSTWLNQGRWDDELKPATSAVGRQGGYTPNHHITDGQSDNPFRK
jgi:hypothetical protein